jgi:hypothetical protein
LDSTTEQVMKVRRSASGGFAQLVDELHWTLHLAYVLFGPNLGEHKEFLFRPASDAVPSRAPADQASLTHVSARSTNANCANCCSSALATNAQRDHTDLNWRPI